MVCSPSAIQILGYTFIKGCASCSADYIHSADIPLSGCLPRIASSVILFSSSLENIAASPRLEPLHDLVPDMSLVFVILRLRRYSIRIFAWKPQ